SPMQDTACKKGGSRAELHSLEPMATTDFIFSGLEGAEAMKVTSMGLQAIQKAAGDSMILNCSYTPGPLDTGELDIEWSVVSPDSTQKDQMLLSYGSSTQYQHDDRPSSGGLSFAAGDPSKGDASLLIDQLSPAHSATYQCKVKKLPGVDMQKTSLVVMVKPSVPECWLQGEQLFGEDVSLHCQSAKGSTPLKYTWRRESMGPMPAAATQSNFFVCSSFLLLLRAQMTTKPPKRNKNYGASAVKRPTPMKIMFLVFFNMIGLLHANSPSHNPNEFIMNFCRSAETLSEKTKHIFYFG
uniref:Ig-like domain-containing protein n=1 Tax=Oryzias sinensis TaxID=183150 RepID=A0A8C7XN70_9TELE